MLVTRVTAKSFKGWTGEQELSQRTLFVGPNGAGKSCISQALQLIFNGSVIGAKKTNDAILSTFGEGDKLVVGGVIDGGSLFERGFTRKADGSVAQGYQIEGKRVSESFFLKALGESGSPVILNVADFMAKSDEKKLEELFYLYPPAGDVGAVQGKIDATKEKINALAGKVKTSEQAAARIASSKSQIEVPAGTLAEVDAQIAALETELKEAQENLTQIRMEEQKAADALKAKEEADRKEMERLAAEAERTRKAGELKERERIVAEEVALRERLTAERKERERVEADTRKTVNTNEVTDEAVLESLTTKPGPMEQEVEKRFGPEKAQEPGFHLPHLTPLGLTTERVIKHEAALSIQSIIAAMNAAGGCEACFAKMIAHRELRKYKEVVTNG